MVRLKDFNRSNCDFEILISIPYGAIKRYFEKQYYLFCRISIPYGAIKSIFPCFMYFLKVIFQFLMVRLKDWYSNTPTFRISISIPYGAIKSDIFFTQIKIRAWFQFLMVRLKDVCKRLFYSVLDKNFNSLWCD